MSKMSQRLEQRQKFNPRQILEANLMQLNIWSLEKRILEEIENNPTLDIEDEDENQEATMKRAPGGLIYIHWKMDKGGFQKATRLIYPDGRTVKN